jgi:hypothetical protein
VSLMSLLSALQEALAASRRLRERLSHGEQPPDEPPLPKGYHRAGWMKYVWVSDDGSHVVVGLSSPFKKDV